MIVSGRMAAMNLWEEINCNNFRADGHNESMGGMNS